MWSGTFRLLDTDGSPRASIAARWAGRSRRAATGKAAKRSSSGADGQPQRDVLVYPRVFRGSLGARERGRERFGRHHLSKGNRSRAIMNQQVLRDADRRKDEFLATLAHELRNTLTPIAMAMH